MAARSRVESNTVRVPVVEEPRPATRISSFHEQRLAQSSHQLDARQGGVECGSVVAPHVTTGRH
jgi:hypothetical protein